MKKIVVLLAFAMMLLPLNAFAMQPLSQSDMGSITAQSGVSIGIDDVKIYQSIEYISYTDTDGLATTDLTDPSNPVYTPGTPGSVNISNLQMMVNLNGITHLNGSGLPISPGRPAMGNYDATKFSYNNVYDSASAADDSFQARALTIDVGTMPVLSEGKSYNVLGAATGIAVAGVQIGLPTLEVTQTALTFDVTLESAGSINAPTKNAPTASLGRISIGANTMLVLDGTIEIAPH